MLCETLRHIPTTCLIKMHLILRVQGSESLTKAEKLKITDAITYLAKLPKTKYPDVIYLDPMFPSRSKSALNKKSMRILKEIVGKDSDSDQLLKIALKTALKRVVVKRPKLAPHLAGKKPDITYRGKSSRFDVYLIMSGAKVTGS